MDSITQAILGAAIGEATLGRKIGNKGAIAGAIVATIPDLDVMLHLFYSKLEMLSIHRGYSHSIAFSFMGAFLIAFVLSKMRLFKGVKFKEITIFAWLCLFTHILLDTFTAYGTQLYLPFSNTRVGFDCVNVIDPMYTIPLLLGLTLTIWFRNSKYTKLNFNKYGLIISSFYLLFTLANKEMVTMNIKSVFEANNINYQTLLTMPFGFANLNWYGVAKSQDSIFMLKHSIIYGSTSSIESFPIHEEYLQALDTEIADKMRWFARGFYTVEKVNDGIRIYNLQVDMRGIIKQGNFKAPTAGYFEISKKNGQTIFGSGTIEYSENTF